MIKFLETAKRIDLIFNNNSGYIFLITDKFGKEHQYKTKKLLDYMSPETLYEVMSKKMNIKRMNLDKLLK